MDRRMAAHCSTSSLSPSSRPTPSASGDNSKAMLDDATKMGKEEKERQHDGRRLSNEGKNESRVRRHSKQEPKMKDNMSPGKKKSPTSKSWKLPDCTPGDSTSNIADSCVSREQPSAVSSSRHTFHGLDPEWAAKMNARYGLEGQESPFSVVGEVKKERSPPRQPKRADETPPPTPPKPAQPLSKPQWIAKPHSDPYENEDEDPATAALRREIRLRDEDLRTWIGANLNEPIFLSLLQDKMEKRKKMVDRLEELKKSPKKEEYTPRFEGRRKTSPKFGQISADSKRKGKIRSKPTRSDSSFRQSHDPNQEEVGNRGQRCQGKRTIEDDMGYDNHGSGIDWKKLKLENEKKREVDRASQMEARNRLAALAGGYVTATGEAVDSPLEPAEASTSSGFGGRPLNPETFSGNSRKISLGRGIREETEVVELDSDDDDDDCDYHGDAERNMSSADLYAVHGIRVVDSGQKRVHPFHQDSPETMVLSDEQEDEWEDQQNEQKQSDDVDLDEKKGDNSPATPTSLLLDAPDIEEELNTSEMS